MTTLLLGRRRRCFTLVGTNVSLLKRFVSTSFASSLSTCAHCEEHRIACIDLAALVLAAPRLNVIVGESVAFPVDVVDVH
jgi:hypothetical protein